MAFDDPWLLLKNGSTITFRTPREEVKPVMNQSPINARYWLLHRYSVPPNAISLAGMTTEQRDELVLSLISKLEN